jgi:hypothetical protein
VRKNTYQSQTARLHAEILFGENGIVRKKPPIQIALSDPYPFLDPGTYIAVCSEADFTWSQQWKKWIARLVLQPENYYGPRYIGRLCKFLGLGKDPQRPYAGPQSHFRRLLVEVNGAQPPSLESGVEIFVGVRYEIEVETVKADRHGKPLNPAHWYSIVRGIHPCKHGVSGLSTAQPVNLRPFNPSTQGTLATLITDQHSNTVNTPLAKAAGAQRK